MAVIDWDLYKKDANYRSKIINQLAEEQKKTDVSGTPVASYQTQLDKADARAVEKKQADEKVHKQFDSKSWGEFAGWQAAGAAGALGFAYGLPWLSSNILPYTTARGIYGLTQAAGTTLIGLLHSQLRQLMLLQLGSEQAHPLMTCERTDLLLEMFLVLLWELEGLPMRLLLL